MPYSFTDFEKVDSFLFAIVQALNSLQNTVSGPNAPSSSSLVSLINAIDAYRNDVGCAIEEQGKREL